MGIRHIKIIFEGVPASFRVKHGDALAVLVYPKGGVKMAAKYQLITELYQRTGKMVTRNPQAWQGFLSSAGLLPI